MEYLNVILRHMGNTRGVVMCHLTVMHYRTQRICQVPGALGKAQFALGKGFAECCTRQRPLGKKWVGKDVFAECLLSGTRPTRQSWNRKKPEKMGILTKKIEFFLIGGGPHRSAPIHLWLFSRKFHGYAADGTRTRDLPLRTNLLYHYTTPSLVSGFRFSSQYIILNRV
jgi:hypothetical protein